MIFNVIYKKHINLQICYAVVKEKAMRLRFNYQYCVQDCTEALPLCSSLHTTLFIIPNCQIYVTVYYGLLRVNPVRLSRHHSSCCYAIFLKNAIQSILRTRYIIAVIHSDNPCTYHYFFTRIIF